MVAGTNSDALKRQLVDIVSADAFKPALASKVLEALKNTEGDFFFEEDNILEGCEYDLLGHACVFGTLDALKWVLKERVMGPPDLDVSLYTALALADELANEEVLRYLLTKYGVTFSEVCFGDLSPERQELAIELGSVEGDED